MAEENDVDTIMSLIEDCIKDMESHGIHQWNEYYYPTREIIQADIESGYTYISKRSHEVLGTISLNEDEPSGYEKLNWSTPRDRVLVIHRLAVNPLFQRQGIGRSLLDYAEKYAIDNSVWL